MNKPNYKIYYNARDMLHDPVFQSAWGNFLRSTDFYDFDVEEYDIVPTHSQFADVGWPVIFRSKEGWEKFILTYA